MSDGIEIRSGGVVAVDPADLEAAAGRIEGIASECAESAGAMRSAAGMLASATGIGAESGEAEGLATQADRLADAARDLAGRLRQSALFYAYADLVARRDSAPPGEDAEIAAAIARIERDHPELVIPVRNALDARWFEVHAPLLRDAWLNSLWLGPTGAIVPLTLGSLQAIVGVADRGVVRSSDRLKSDPAVAAVSVTETRREASTAPGSLRAAVERVPSGQARVRVEKYSLPDGTREWAVYVTGTRVPDFSGREPWDMRSNTQLYSGERSASYEGTVAALRAAGARPGDTVHAVGHSQGGMVTSRLATEGEFHVATLVAVGAPIEAAVGDDTLSVVLRHRDDPVAALASGGAGEIVGAPGSFVAERDVGGTTIVDPLATHHLVEYADTAALVDAAGDPRADGIRRAFGRLEGATSVEATEYAVERTG